MDIREWLEMVLANVILFPAAAACYVPMKNQMKYSVRKTAAMCLGVLIPYSFANGWIICAFDLDANALFLLELVGFFLLYRHTLRTDFPRALAVYVGVCAVLTFTSYLSNAYEISRFPSPELWLTSDYAYAESILVQVGLACLMTALAWLFRRQIWWIVDHLGFAKVWYSTVAVSGTILILNLASFHLTIGIEAYYYDGPFFRLFPVLEICLLVLLVCVYVLFYQSSRLMLERAQLEQRTQLLELQSHQYQALQEHMRQTARLRHDFRHSLRLLSALAEQENLAGIRSHLAEYERSLTEKAPASYCANTALNALFGYYEEMAASAGVETDWKIQLPDPLTVSELDLASLLGNLLENGINGCRTLRSGKRRFSLTTELRQGNSLYIVSTNSFDGHVRKGKNGYYSTRHDGRGIGLASIAAVAEKYNGSARFSNSDTEFFVDVVLKV